MVKFDNESEEIDKGGTWLRGGCSSEKNLEDLQLGRRHILAAGWSRSRP